jgi:3-hydroxybutyryl-CoA dehydrogenase
MTEIIAVIGAGTMGSGIAQVAAEAGYRVNLVDTRQEIVDRGIVTIRKFLGRMIEKGELSPATGNEMLSRLSGSTDIDRSVKDAEIVVEAVFEKFELKKEIFQKLDALCPPNVILASNTSTLSISSIAAVTSNPERVIGMHYFIPVRAMRLVEVIRGKNTTDATADKTIELCRKLGKTPIVVKDIPGFIVNRFMALIFKEAADMIYRGDSTAEDIDRAMKLGLRWPMGITEGMDLAGVDIVANALAAMYQMTGEERYKPSPLFEKMLAENKLGRKTGEGFYKYDKK